MIAQSVSIALISIAVIGFTNNLRDGEDIGGAWQLKNGDEEKVLIIQDGYFAETGYNRAAKKFLYTRGGSYDLQSGQIRVVLEFDTRSSGNIGKSFKVPYKVSNGKLDVHIDDDRETWTRIDDGRENLAGTWKITGRLQEGKVVPIHRTGPRKTVKILSGTRFQWTAINPETKEFFGTGGGNYTFKNGKYTENIEFFSRDSSRVGASLNFDGKLENGEWHHSGLSSRGDRIYEIWTRSPK